MASVDATLTLPEQQLPLERMAPDRSPDFEPRISHAVLLTGAQLSRGVLRMLFVIVSARVLGPETFGVYALLFATVEMVAVASGSGYVDYLTREAARDERLGWGIGAQLAPVRAGLGVTFAALGLGLLWLLGYPHAVIAAAAYFALTLIPRSLTETVQGVLRGTHRYFGFLAIELAFGLGLVAGAARLLLYGGGLRSVIIAELVASAAAFVLAFSLGLKFRTRQRTSLPIRDLVKVSAIFNIYAFLGNLYDRLDVVLLSRLAGNYATGIYSAAYRPLGTVQLLPYGVLYSLLPALSRGECNLEERTRLEKAMGLLLCAAFLLVLGTMAFAYPFIHFIYGTRFAESAAALRLLIWAVMFRYVDYSLNLLLLAARKERMFVITSLVCLGVNLIGNLVFIPLFSWRAAAVLTTFTELVLLIQNIYWLLKIFGAIPQPFGWMRNSVVFLLLLGTAMVGAKFGFPLLLGSASILAFLGYLFWSGMMGEFRAVWQPLTIA